MELEDSWSNYDNRMCLGSGKELNEDDDSYNINAKQIILLYLKSFHQYYLK